MTRPNRVNITVMLGILATAASVSCLACDSKDKPQATTSKPAPVRTAATPDKKTATPKPTTAAPAAAAGDQRPAEIRKFDGANNDPQPIEPGKKLTLDRELLGQAYLGRWKLAGAAGKYELHVVAHATSCLSPGAPTDEPASQWPAIELYVDLKQAHKWFIDSKKDQEFVSKVLELDSGSHVLGLAFTNDYVDDKCDRNLWVKSIELRKAAEP